MVMKGGPVWGLFFVGAPFRPNILNMPKSASGLGKWGKIPVLKMQQVNTAYGSG